MADGAPNTPDDFDLDALIDAGVSRRLEEEEKRRNRNKQPKDFGDFLDRVSDAVIEKLENKGKERRAAAEAADQEPERGGPKGGFAQWWKGQTTDD